MSMKKVFVKISELSEITGLPKATIKRLADEEIIPAIKVTRGFRFNPEAVLQALDKLAAHGGKENAKSN